MNTLNVKLTVANLQHLCLQRHCVSVSVGALLFWVKYLSRVGQPKRGQNNLLAEEDKLVVTETRDALWILEVHVGEG